ncbi:hypothetical protein KFK09_024524 [Dendrobium nobile]|uniref:Uncharacterized protein n=1 Tax=Dendrobium nobile TaxID=94219 RepID=A0A8T3ADZ5_DENNO|nr:hypothetical protein KFK09_024524 [Dendrobium nobile]
MMMYKSHVSRRICMMPLFIFKSYGSPNKINPHLGLTINRSSCNTSLADNFLSNSFPLYITIRLNYGVSLVNEIYAWIGCNSAKFGHLYAAAPTRPSNTVSVTSLLKGNADNTGSSMARRLVLKTGLSVVLACNLPKDSPILEASAERKLIGKLRSLGYIRAGPSAA